MTTLDVLMLASNNWLDRHGRELCLTYIALLFLAVGAFLLSGTIRFSDTDMWYHLAGGRALMETGAPSNPFDRSYLATVKPFYNYYWGFQFLLYLTHEAAGYIGILALRAVLVVATAWFVLRTILQDRDAGAATFGQLAVITLTIYLLSLRGIAVRPHYFSYLFIAVFIYVLSHRPRLIPLLPLCTLLWANTHGIEWIVGALICGSYLLHSAVGYARSRDRTVLHNCGWVLLCLPVLLANPNGIHLFETPFLTPPETYQFIAELGPLSLASALDYSGGLDKYNVTLALMVLLVVGAVGVLNARPGDHLMALLLAFGGAVLLARGARFVSEWILLSTPLLGVILVPRGERVFNIARVSALAVIFVLITSFWWTENEPYWHAYPFDEGTLPRGTTDFVEQSGINGKYLVPETLAGYVEWRLPATKVHMDLQMPPFDSQDYFDAFAARHTEPGLTHLVDTYQPDFIAIERNNPGFANIAARQSRYVPVFFDKQLVLYIDGARHEALAKEHALHYVDPFNPDLIRRGSIDEVVLELQHMLAATDHLPTIKLSLVGYLMALGRYDEALEYLTPLTERYPSNTSVLYFNARIAREQENFEQAIFFYEKLLPLTDDPSLMGGLLGECYFISGDPQRAYEVFARAINPYKDAQPDLVQYYLFAFSAYLAGDDERATELADIIETLDDGENETLMNQVRELRQLISQGHTEVL